MRHQRSGKKLGRDSAHRKALYSNLAGAVIEHGRIKTTVAKAKAVRPIAEEMIVEKVEMPSGQPRDLRQRVVHALRVERSAAFEERVLVTEIAVLGTSARDDKRVGHQIAPTVDEVASNGRQPVEGAVDCRAIHATRPALSESTSAKIR